VRASAVVAGYKPYLESIADLLDGQELISSGMTGEVERCRAALVAAAGGRVVALVSSGDAGIYGMAGLALELARAEGFDVPIEIVPGMTAASAAAAALGAPLMLDFAVISLSDLLVPWDEIRVRLEAAAAGDLVTALYNPKSKKRVRQLEATVEIFLRHRPPSTPVGVCTAAGTAEAVTVHCTLGELLDQDIGMRSLVIIGSRRSTVIDGRFVTTRGYEV
jgi:precorrin-3B C17-methyltransferase